MTPDTEIVWPLIGPARHAANNMAMVLLMNLEATASSLPAEGREGRQVGRALQAARAYDTMVRGLLGLLRAEAPAQVKSGTLVADLLPLLALAANRKLVLDVAENAILEVTRPRFDAALLRLAMDAAALPMGQGLALHLRGAALRLDWPLEPGTRDLLAAAGIRAEQDSGGLLLHLPRAG
ncbi:hypothetical protein [Roseomonas sp. BN140053]|uniref:hypothetical protein n=1 Tax=Roseomonas sp. BN140053 TaxID=3391898 RepID=UPI0039E84109